MADCDLLSLHMFQKYGILTASAHLHSLWIEKANIIYTVFSVDVRTCVLALLKWLLKMSQELNSV